MPKQKIIYGGWQQRTAIHLDEIFEFFKNGSSELNLDKNDLKKYWKALKITGVSKKNDYLECVEAETELGIKIKYFEDGLHYLEIENDNIEASRKNLIDYYNDRLNLATEYIFSLGAPTANRLTESRLHQTIIISADSAKKEVEFVKNEKESVIICSSELTNKAEALAGLAIFVEEINYQLHIYLNLHRKIWEETAKIKNKREIKGKEIDSVRGRLDDFKKIVDSARGRTEQMEIFAANQSQAAKAAGLSSDLNEETKNYFSLKFNSMNSSLKYFQRIWEITANFVQSAIDSIVEIQSKAASQGIRSLKLITSIGILGGIIGYLAEDLPAINPEGIVYLLIVLIGTYLINLIVDRIYRTKRYKIEEK